MSAVMSNRDYACTVELKQPGLPGQPGQCIQINWNDTELCVMFKSLVFTVPRSLADHRIASKVMQVMIMLEGKKLKYVKMKPCNIDDGGRPGLRV